MSKKQRETDTVSATLQGKRLLRDTIRDRISRERQQEREANCKPTYSREKLVEQAYVSIDTLKRLQKGVSVRRDYADAIARVLGLELTDLIEPSRNQRHPDFYVERPPFESQCYETIFSQQGALVRVKAPHRMGKTWFVEQVLSKVKENQYQFATLSFYDADSAVFTDLQTFLKWFCSDIGNSLELPNQLEEQWKNDLGDVMSCTDYVEKYLLSDINVPLVLVLDDVDLVFEQSLVANDFCRLLKTWYDKAIRARSRSSAWRNLRLVIVHSTDIYAALDIHHSPLAGVGTVFSLRKFHLNEVTQLVQRYALHWEMKQIEQIMALTGGNPYLIHEALNYLMLHPEMKIEKFLQDAVTEIGPYYNHLGQLLSTLQHNPNLIAAFKEVVNSRTSIKVKSPYVFQLDRMGLVEVKESGVLSSCELYSQYFSNRL